MHNFSIQKKPREFLKKKTNIYEMNIEVSRWHKPTKIFKKTPKK